MVKMPVFFTSVVASVAKLSRRPAEAGDSENASLLHLCGSQCGQALKEACAHLGLHFMLLGKRPDKRTFGHHFLNSWLRASPGLPFPQFSAVMSEGTLALQNVMISFSFPLSELSRDQLTSFDSSRDELSQDQLTSFDLSRDELSEDQLTSSDFMPR